MSKVQELARRSREQGVKVVLIGASAGGVEVLNLLLPAFRKPSQLCVAVVLHLPPKGPNLLPQLYEESCQFKVLEPLMQEDLKSEHIYIAPPNYHLSLEADETISLSSEEPLNFSRPSIDILFESAAHAFGQKCLAMLLTGANNDGARGLYSVQKKGGLAVVQAPGSAEYPTMPASGLALVPEAQALEVEELVALIHAL